MYKKYDNVLDFITIQNIKAMNPIEDVAAQRYGVKFKKSGKYLMAICPLPNHQDKNASFAVNPQKQYFYCFGCKKGGDVIKFVMMMENVDFIEAMKILGWPGNNSASITPARAAPKVKKTAIPKEEEKVEITDEQIKKNEAFLKGLKPYLEDLTVDRNDKNAMLFVDDMYLRHAFYVFDVRRGPDGYSEDWWYLCGRIAFPLRDENGRLVAFAGRSTDDKNCINKAAKYLNTSAKKGFDKGSFLYNLDKAKEAILKEGFVFVVEGYKDAAAMYAATFHNVVALDTSHMTKEQFELLKKYTNKVYLLLDGDEAGRSGMLKIEKEYGHRFKEMRRLMLPDGEDPFSLYCRLGRPEFKKYIEYLMSTPDLAEEMLLAVSIKYGISVICNVSGYECYLPEYVATEINILDCPFTNEEHAKILKLLIKSKGWVKNFPPHLTLIANELLNKHKQRVEGMFEAMLRRNPLEELEVHQADCVKKYLYLYLKHRLEGQIRDLIASQISTNTEEKDWNALKKTMKYKLGLLEGVKKELKELDNRFSDAFALKRCA